MKTALIASIFAAGLFAGSTAAASTVTMSGNESHMFTLHNVSSASLTFSVPPSDGYANFGGYMKWSTREDGRQDSDGPGATCLECGYSAGGWSVVNDPWQASNDKAAFAMGNGQASKGTKNGKPFKAEIDTSSEQLSIDFGDTRETVYLWVRPTHGTGTVRFAETSASEISAVPLPAGAWLLITALGAIGLMRRRKTH